MKKLLLICLLGSMLGLTGCATLGTSLNMVPKEKDDIVPIKIGVASTPQGASIYVNDKLVGYTPAEVSFYVKYKCNLVTAVCIWYACNPAEQYILKVSKEGYKDAVEVIQFDQKGSFPHYFYEPGMNVDRVPGDYFFPSKTNYDFVLEPGPIGAKKMEGQSSEKIAGSNADEIREYKKLLDDGVITQDEFEKKKQQLLKD